MGTSTAFAARASAHYSDSEAQPPKTKPEKLEPKGVLEPKRDEVNFARFLVPPSLDAKRSAPRCSDSSAASRPKVTKERSAQLADEEHIVQMAAGAKPDRIRRFYMRLRHMTFLDTLLRQERAQAEKLHADAVQKIKGGYDSRNANLI